MITRMIGSWKICHLNRLFNLFFGIILTFFMYNVCKMAVLLLINKIFLSLVYDLQIIECKVLKYVFIYVKSLLPFL